MSRFILVDSSGGGGSQVGEILSIDQDLNEVSLTALLNDSDIAALSGRTVALLLRLGEFLSTGNVYFDALGCEGGVGNAFVRTKFGFLDVFSPAVVIENGAVRILYVATSPTAQGLNPASTLSFDNICTVGGAAETAVVPAALVAADLHTDFPTPIRVQVAAP